MNIINVGNKNIKNRVKNHKESEKISTREVLTVLGVGSLVIASVAFPSLPMALGAIYKKWKDINKRDLGIIIKRLEKQEMISIQEKHGKTNITLTERGKQRLLEYDFENIQLQSKKTDGKWRLVIFDIPEEKKSRRDVFRRKLIQLGMVRMQDSVFASAFPCKKEVDFLCHFLEISDFVTLVSLNSIERGENLIFKRLFNGE